VYDFNENDQGINRAGYVMKININVVREVDRFKCLRSVLQYNEYSEDCVQNKNKCEYLK